MFGSLDYGWVARQRLVLGGVKMGPDIHPEPMAQVGLAGPLSPQSRVRRTFIVVGGRLRARSRHQLGHRLAVVAIAGKAVVDLSESIFPPDGIQLRVVALGADVEVILPPDITWSVRRHALGRARVEVGAEIRRLPDLSRAR